MNIKASKHYLKSTVLMFKTEKKVPIVKLTPDNKLLSGKVALIVGGGGGIGAAITEEFIKSGCKVIVTSRTKAKCEEICKGNINIKTLCLDLNDIQKYDDDIKEACAIFGKIDIFVNASGIHENYVGTSFLNISEKSYDQIMNVNLKANYFLCQSIANYFINNKIKGHILIISSQSALEPSWSPYRLSKRGLDGLITGIAQQLLPHGIIVNAIGPGPTATSMQEYKNGDTIYSRDNLIERYTMPSEAAEYAKLLVSNLGDTIVGQTIYMSGGRGIIDMR